MRLHAFGSLCDFVMTLFCRLPKCLMRLDVFLFVMRFRAEISCFLLHLVSNIRASKVTIAGMHDIKSIRMLEDDVT
jgi:hypothetical protein